MSMLLHVNVATAVVSVLSIVLLFSSLLSPTCHCFRNLSIASEYEEGGYYYLNNFNDLFHSFGKTLKLKITSLNLTCFNISLILFIFSDFV